MGNPLAPTLANIYNTLLCNLEDMFLNSCSMEFKPLYYRHYLDDIFEVFKEKQLANNFFIILMQCIKIYYLVWKP